MIRHTFTCPDGCFDECRRRALAEERELRDAEDRRDAAEQARAAELAAADEAPEPIEITLRAKYETKVYYPVGLAYLDGV